MENEKIQILYLCTGNSCRSQIAEGFTRDLKSEQIDAYSAGVDPKGIDPRAIKVMAEAGIDISGQRSKSVNDVKDMEFDFVITLCDNAHKTCPTFPAKTSVVHMAFDDPPRLAAGSQNEEEALEHYRGVRDKIKRFVERLPEVLAPNKDTAGFDPARFAAGIHSALGQMPEYGKGSKKP